MIRSTVLAGLGLAMVTSAVAMTPQEIRQCRAMAETFQAKQSEILALQESQAALAVEAEALGEAWEAKEEQRLFSESHAAEADEAKRAFETARNVANRAAMDLNSKARMFQADAAQFNEKCAAQ